VLRHFGYGSRPHLGDPPPPRRHGFFAAGSYTRSNGEVQKTVKASSGHVVKYWIPKFYLTNPNTESSISSYPM
jgi:hypothetical protein